MAKGLTDLTRLLMDLICRDLKHIWHPCSQMKDYEQFPPLIVAKAYGPYIELANGQRIIDAISSWWCKSLGHNHPRLKAALQAQLERFEHVILANSTFEVIVALSERLAALTRTLDKVFYASDGSSAVEIALKMSLHAQQLQAANQRTQFIALQNGYHGETFAALGLSDLGLYRKAYESQLAKPIFITALPYVTSPNDPLWQDCSAVWPAIEAQLNLHAETLAAVIVEPIVQGAGGMRIYSQDLLRRLRQWTAAQQVYLIADEIMTGLGRTGPALACQHAGIEPDFVCLGKGLTAGWLPMSVVLTSTKVYELFYADYTMGRAFLHSHTFSGNALAAAVALECLNLLQQEAVYTEVARKQVYLYQFMQAVAEVSGRLKNVRAIGAIAAADLCVEAWPSSQRLGYRVFQQAIKLGAWLRPLGNTLYWLPPLNADLVVLEDLRDITLAAIRATG